MQHQFVFFREWSSFLPRRQVGPSLADLADGKSAGGGAMFRISETWKYQP
jgi:hypothetical protein